MKRLLIICLVIFEVVSLSAQSFLKKSNGLQIRTFYHQQNINYYLNTKDSTGNIYTVLYDTVSAGFNFGKEYSQIRLRIFNGMSWLSTKPIKIYSLHTIDAPRVLDIQSIGNTIYLCGSFDSTENNLGSGIISYNNHNWQRVSSTIMQRYPDYFEVNRLHVFGRELFISGNFDSIPGERVNSLLLLDKTGWKSIGSGALKGYQNLSGNSNVFFFGGTDSLYVYNKNRIKPDSIEIGNRVIKKLGVLRGNDFEQLNYPFQYIGALAEYKKQLVALPSSQLIYIHQIAIFNNGNWSTYQLPGNDSFYVTNYLGHHEFGGKLNLFFQSPLAQVRVYQFDGTALSYRDQFKLSDNYLNLEFRTFNDEALICGNFGNVIQNQYSDSFKHIVGISFVPRSMISGICFKDNNQDGQYQPGEPLLSGIKVYDKNASLQSISNAAGRYTLYCSTGKAIAIGAQSENGLEYTGTSGISNTKDSIYDIDIPMQNSIIQDAGVYLYSGTGNRAKQGFVTPYTIELNNGTDKTQNMLVRVDHDPSLRGFKFNNFGILNQNKRQFSVLKTLEAHSKVLLYYSAVFEVDSFELGEQVPTKVSLTINDDNNRNNSDTIIQEVVSAYDPNIKVAIPSAVVDKQSIIKYVIYFENLGNDTALNVTVIDTFGSLLSITDVVYGGTTHGNVAPSIENNCLIWHFENIKLPPRSTDSINNKGHVSFRTLLNKQAQKGDTIYNKAAIFFDYQKPVITNKARVVFIKNSEFSSINKTHPLSIYPNPSQGSLHYRAEGVKQLEIYNLLGQVIFQIALEDTGYIELPESMADGIYTMRADGIQCGQMIIRR